MSHEQLILDILAALVVAQIKDITILAGYHDVSVCRKKIKYLIETGLVKKIQSGDGSLIYTLTKQGLNHLGISRRPYEFRNQNTHHDIMCGRVASYMYIIAGLSIYDFKFDRSQRSENNSDSIPDIVYANGTRCIEVELTLKENLRFQDKYLSLQDYDSVRWIYPAERPSIKNRLVKLNEEFGVNPKKNKIITLEHVVEKVDSFDLKTNNPRYDVKG